MSKNILVINPGSTSDDIGYYKDGKAVFDTKVRYSAAQLAQYQGQNVTDQLPLRKPLIIKALEEHNIPLSEITAIIGRGGIFRPVEGGIYAINKLMLDDAHAGARGFHASNLGAILAYDIAKEIAVPSFIADPVVVDELEPVARLSGIPEIPRDSIFHALNQKRVGALAAETLGGKYQDFNFIIIHAGGGISVGAHKKGRVTDVNNAFAGEGPMTPQRSGAVPGLGLARMCFSGKYTLKDVTVKLNGGGGMVAYTGTTDMLDVVGFATTGKKAEDSLITCTREEAALALGAMIYQIVKEVGAMAAVLEGKIDGILFSGGMAYNEYIVEQIKTKLAWIAPLYVFPGGDEKTALRIAAEKAIDDPKIVKEYK